MNGEPLKYKELTFYDHIEVGDRLMVRPDITNKSIFMRKSDFGWAMSAIDIRHYSLPQIYVKWLLKNRGKIVTVTSVDSDMRDTLTDTFKIAEANKCDDLGFIPTMFMRVNK